MSAKGLHRIQWGRVAVIRVCEDNPTQVGCIGHVC